METMLFIYPMWDNLSQQIGKQKCTPFGYTLDSLARGLGFVGLLLLMAVSVYLGYRAMTGTFHASLCWWLTVPFSTGVVAEIMYQISMKLADSKGFEYDYENREASWLENGKRVTYKYESRKPETTNS